MGCPECVRLSQRILRRIKFAKELMETRRFPPPWSVEELDVCLVVKDRGQFDY
jgi:hypothetical protein